MPIVAPIMKVQSCRQFGANIIIHVINLENKNENNEEKNGYILGVFRAVILASHASLPCGWPRKRP
jgi:hypothetical protein